MLDNFFLIKTNHSSTILISSFLSKKWSADAENSDEARSAQARSAQARTLKLPKNTLQGGVSLPPRLLPLCLSLCAWISVCVCLVNWDVPKKD